MDQTIIFLLLVVSVASHNAAAICPAACQCSDSDEELEVNCSSMQLQTIPDDLPENATVLIFSRNNLGDPLLDSVDLQTLVSLPTLVDLRLNRNQIQLIHPDAFLNLTAIKRLVLAQNLIQFMPKDALSKLPNLEELDLSGNLITTLEDNVFSNQQLAKINLRDNRINSIGQDAFQGLSNLDTLILQGNVIGVLSLSFEYLVGLKSLDLSGNLIKAIPNGVFDENRLLERLSIDRNNIGYLNLLTFFNLQNLIELSLTYNSLNSTVFSLLPLKPNLTKLFLYGNKIEKIPQRAFFYNTELVDIDLSSNCISSIDANAFMGLHRLENLQLSRNNLTTITEGTLDHFSEGLRICLVGNPWNCDCDIIYLQESMKRLTTICGEATCSNQGDITIQDWSPFPVCSSSTQRPAPTQIPTSTQRPTSTVTKGFDSQISTTLGKTDRTRLDTEEMMGSENYLVLFLVIVIIVLVIICIVILTLCLCFLARKQAIIKRDDNNDVQQNFLDDLFRNSRLSRMSTFWEKGEEDDKRLSIYDKIKEVFSTSDRNGGSEMETYLEPSRPRRQNSYQDHELKGKVNRVMMEEVGNDGCCVTLPDGIHRRPMRLPPQQTSEDSHEPGEYAEAEGNREHDNRGRNQHDITRIASSNNEGRLNAANHGTYRAVATDIGTIQREPLPAIPGSQRPNQIEQGMEENPHGKFGDGLYIPLQESPDETKSFKNNLESTSEDVYLEPKEQGKDEFQGNARVGVSSRKDGERPTSIYAD